MIWECDWLAAAGEINNGRNQSLPVRPASEYERDQSPIIQAGWQGHEIKSRSEVKNSEKGRFDWTSML